MRSFNAWFVQVRREKLKIDSYQVSGQQVEGYKSQSQKVHHHIFSDNDDCWYPRRNSSNLQSCETGALFFNLGIESSTH